MLPTPALYLQPGTRCSQRQCPTAGGEPDTYLRLHNMREARPSPRRVVGCTLAPHPRLAVMSSPPGPPITLGNIRDLGVRSLAVTCELCHHEAVLPGPTRCSSAP